MGGDTSPYKKHDRPCPATLGKGWNVLQCVGESGPELF